MKLLCSFESPAICGTSRMLTMGAEGGKGFDHGIFEQCSRHDESEGAML